MKINKNVLKKHLLWSSILTLSACSAQNSLFWSAENSTENAEIERRQNSLPLSQTIVGALVALDDMQIRIRSGKGNPQFDSCENSGCNNTMPFNLPLIRNDVNVPIYIPSYHINNVRGEWASNIHIFPKKLGNQNGEFLFEVQDSNMFVPANTSIPLYLFSDTQMPAAPVWRMRRLAHANVRSYKRDKAFSFWPQHKSAHGDYMAVAPLNIPANLAYAQAVLRIIPGLKDNPRIQKLLEWMDPKNNPAGVEALSNIPNDADDSSLALALEALATQNNENTDPLSEAEKEGVFSAFSQFRDLNRTREDGRDSWKGTNTGAFLTWLKNENTPTFSSPGEGVIPLDANNVDCVVNANAVFGLALNGQQNIPGFSNAVASINLAIEKQAWEKCGLYYPQKMIFPYSASRAFRNGGVLELRQGMSKLLHQVLAEQRRYEASNPHLPGAFPGGMDVTPQLATALGAVTLLNIGKEIAIEEGVAEEFSRTLERAIDFLLRTRVAMKLHDVSKQENWCTTASSCKKQNAWAWSAGVFFAASNWELAHWRSQAYTTAVAVEALAKFYIGYDLQNNPNSRIELLPTSDNTPSLGIKY